MKKLFTRSLAVILVCLFVISGINFAVLSSNETNSGDKLSAINIAISGKVSLMFYFSDLSAVDHFKVTVPNRDGTSTTTTVKVSSLERDSGGRYLLKVGLPAAQQADKVTIQSVSANGTEGKTRRYSIRDYADKLFAFAEANPDNAQYLSAAVAVKFMLNYGAMAQKYFDYNTDSLANDGLYANGTNPVTGMSASDVYGINASNSSATNESILKFTNVNAYLEDTVSLRFYFEYNGSECDVQNLKTYINSVEYQNEVVCASEGYYVLINNIPATRFNNQYRIRISDGKESAEMSYSVLNYLQRKLEITNDDDFTNLAHSMFQFYVNTSVHTSKDIPGFESMSAACKHYRAHIDAQSKHFICSDCGLTITPEPAASFTVSKMFSDYMVVQRGEHIRVWGFAPSSENGKKISAEFKGIVAETLVSSGEWCLTFDEALEADTVGATMTISGKNTTVTFNDVLVGDVYLVLGQSNAAFRVSESIAGGNTVDINENSIIRLNNLNNSGGAYSKKGTDYVYKDLENTTLWTKTTQSQTLQFSAIGYHFAQEMVERSGNTVPVGLMEVAYGGAPLASFLPNDLAELYDSDYYNSQTGQYCSKREASHLGRYLYNCYLAPASRYSVAGTIWYQGESDNPLDFAQVYGDAFGDLVNRLRSTHNTINKNFPVFVVEFPSQYQKPADFEEYWHYLEVGTIRSFMGILPTRIDNLYLSASSDLWNDRAYPNNLHPYCKPAQAKRIAAIAESVIFGNGTLDNAMGPIFNSMVLSEDKKTATITFTNVGDGLTTADGGLNVMGVVGLAESLLGLGKAVTPVSAQITAKNQITVTFDESVKTVAYNYNTSDFYGETLNLCNSAKIPALAFMAPYEDSELGSYGPEDFKEKNDASVGYVASFIDWIKADGVNLTVAGNRVSINDGASMLSISGWSGFGYETLMFGYSIDGENAIFKSNPIDAESAVIEAAGQYAKRFSVTIDISELSAGNHTVDLLALINRDGGTAVKLLSLTIELTVNNIDAVYPLDGSEVILANDLIYDFWQRFDNTPSTYPPIIHEDRYHPVPVTLQWKCKEIADYYLVYVSLYEDLSNAMSFVSTSPSILLENLFVGHDYYWQVDAIVGNKTLRSEIFTFSTVTSPRAVVIDGVSNTRDIGGYVTAEGNRIKQGMVYRGGKLEDITARGKWQFLYGLGIKTDLDLRTPGEGGAGSSSPVSNSLNYVNIDGRYYVESVTGTFGINSEAGKAFIAEEIRVFTNPNNFPVYIHCSLGRDRTGTLVFLLQALCGMEERDLIMEYELSIFSVTGTLDNGNPVSSIIATYDYINNSFAGESFAKKTENFLLSIGITAEEIATIRSLLIEEVQ